MLSNRRTGSKIKLDRCIADVISLAGVTSMRSSSYKLVGCHDTCAETGVSTNEFTTVTQLTVRSDPAYIGLLPALWEMLIVGGGTA